MSLSGLAEPMWANSIKRRTLRGRAHQVLIHGRQWRSMWPWYSPAVLVTTAAVTALVVWLGLGGPLAAAAAVGAPSAIAWTSVALYAYFKPYPWWRTYCREEANSNIGLYALRPEDHSYGPALCRVKTPSGFTTSWSLYRGHRRSKTPGQFIQTSDYPTPGLGWLYPADFEGAPALTDGIYKVTWRIALPHHPEPILVARRSFFIRDEKCAV